MSAALCLLAGAAGFFASPEWKYPPLKCGYFSADEGVTLVSSVRRADAGWAYSYVVTNVGRKKTWLVRGDAIDAARRRECLFALKPGESFAFEVAHADAPGEWFCSLHCYEKKQALFDRSVTFGGCAWMPKSLIPKKKKGE